MNDDPHPHGGGSDKPGQKRQPRTVRFSGNELGSMSRPMKEIAKDAMNIARQRFAGNTYEATDGEKIAVTWQNLKHGLSSDANPAKAIAATRLDEIIQNAEFHKQEPVKEGAFGKGIAAAYVYKTSAAIGGRMLTIGMIVHEKADGKKYYDHFEALGK